MDTILKELPYLFTNPDKMIAFSASSQTQGRGCKNRVWISLGDCVALSLAVVIPGDISHNVVLGHILALVAVRSLRKLYCNEEFVLKWPNDILLRGLKVGGVLVESHSSGCDFQIVVLGIGLNLDVPQVHIPDRPVWPGGSIHKILEHGNGVTEKSLRQEISKAFYHEFAHWRSEGFIPFVDEFNDYLTSKNEMIEVSNVDEEGGYVTGINRGVRNNGSLEVEISDRSTLSLSSGEIRFPLTGELSL